MRSQVLYRAAQKQHGPPRNSVDPPETAWNPQKQHGTPENSTDPPEIRCTQWAWNVWACVVDGVAPRSVATLSNCDDRCMMGSQV